MPLFGRHSETTATSVNTDKPLPPANNGSMFSRNRSVQQTTTASPHRGLLHRHDADPSIVTARERVYSAEAAERDADKALIRARAMVREAREECKRLEREAAEEARLAKVKQSQAASISKRAKPLGRHDRI